MTSRYAFRQLLKNPGFTVVAVMVLALASVPTPLSFIINSILVKPLQVRHPEPTRRPLPAMTGIIRILQSFFLSRFTDHGPPKTRRPGVVRVPLHFVGLHGDLRKRSLRALSARTISRHSVCRPRWPRDSCQMEETSGTPVAVLTHSFLGVVGADPSIVGRKNQADPRRCHRGRSDSTHLTGAQLLAPAIFLPVGMAPT